MISGHHVIEINEDRILAMTDSTFADGHWQPLAPVTEFDDRHFLRGLREVLQERKTVPG